MKEHDDTVDNDTLASLHRASITSLLGGTKMSVILDCPEAPGGQITAAMTLRRGLVFGRWLQCSVLDRLEHLSAFLDS
jgi:hypothetical protein